MPWSTEVTQPPASEPVSLAEAKLHLRVDGDDENALINGLIAAARLHVENHTERALVTQTRRLHLDHFPQMLRLPGGKVTAVTAVNYLDSAGTSVLLSGGAYYALFSTEPATVLQAPNQTWPAIEARVGAVSVTYQCGWANAAAVPQPIKQAILLLIGHWYQNRESVNVGNIVTTLPMGVEALLAPYRVFGFSPC